jgi:plastocyanin
METLGIGDSDESPLHGRRHSAPARRGRDVRSGAGQRRFVGRSETEADLQTRRHGADGRSEEHAFDKECLAAPANTPFTIAFNNQDYDIHNVAIYDKDHGDKALYKGEVIYGPKSITYSVPAQAEGTYEFRCDPHADTMIGTFIVGSGGPPTTSSSTTTSSTTTTTNLLNLPKTHPHQPPAH